MSRRRRDSELLVPERRVDFIDRGKKAPLRLPGDGLDRLAAIRVDAVGRIEATGSFGHRSERSSGFLERIDPEVEVRKVLLEEVENVIASRFTLFTQFQDGGYLVEAQSGRLGVLQEGQPVDGVCGVDPVAVCCPLRLGEDTDLFVVADRFG